MKRIAFAALAALALAGCQDVAPEKLTAPDAEPSRYYGQNFSVSCPYRLEVGLSGYCTASYEDDSPVYGATWSSSNYSVLDLTPGYSGIFVTGASPGSAQIQASVNGTTRVASVTVVSRRILQSITLSPNPATIEMGGTGQLSAVLTATNGEQILRTLTWSSANPSIATVSANGVVTAQGVGTTVVQASAEGVTGSATVTVKPAISMSGATYGYDQNVTVTASALPSGSYYYEWSVRTCTISGSCPTTYSPYMAGQDLNSVSVYVSRHDISTNVRVQLRSSSSGAVLATDFHIIHGEGEPLPPGEPGSCWPKLRC